MRECKWCQNKPTLPFVQLKPGGVLHRWTWYYGGERWKVPMTACGYNLPT